jgi:hypothetical protein
MELVVQLFQKYRARKPVVRIYITTLDTTSCSVECPILVFECALSCLSIPGTLQCVVCSVYFNLLEALELRVVRVLDPGVRGSFI